MKKGNNKVKIEDLLGGLEGIFYPDVVYEGSQYLSLITLFNAGIIKNNVNLAEEYFYNKYKDIFEKNFNDFEMRSNLGNMLLIATPSALAKKNKLILDPTYIFISIATLDLCCDIPFSLTLKKGELDEIYPKKLKELRKKVHSFIAGEVKLEDDEQIFNIYKLAAEHFESLSKKRVGIIKYNSLNVSEKYSNKKIMVVDASPDFTNSDYLISFMKGLEKNITVLIQAYKTLFDDLYNRPLDLKEFSKYIDFDALYLLIAKQYMDYCKSNIKNNGTFSYAVVYLLRYEKAIKQMMKQEKYGVEVRFKNMSYSDGKTFYSTKQFLNEFKKMKEQCPDEELEYYGMIDPKDGNDYTILDNVKKEIERLKAKKETEVLLANWEFFPADESEIKLNKEKIKKRKKEETEINKSLENEIIVDLSCILESTDYVYQLYGKDKFEGYKGFLYSNGYVIFERGTIVNRILQRIPNNATYVMQLRNFKEMSKLPKPEIMDYIKSGGSDVRRIYHTSSWESKILEVANAAPYYNTSVYTDGILTEIKRLIATGELIKDMPKDETMGLKKDFY